jgi:hypothetical protein
MGAHVFGSQIAVSGSIVTRAVVIGLSADGSVLVECDGDDRGVVSCDRLEPSVTERLLVSAGDSVLAWLPPDGERGVVLGRLGPSLAADATRLSTATDNRPADDRPDELVIEARRSITLRVGDGSITIREDGRILIKGKDLVSHAQRVNRIKGGSVAIN